MRRISIALLALSSVFSVSVSATKLTVKEFNKYMAHCYHQTVRIEKQLAPEKISDRYCNLILNNEWTPRESKAVALHNRGLIRQFENKDDAALNDFLTAIQLNTGLPEPHTAAAQIYQQQDKLEKALAHYDKAITLTENDELLVKHRQRVFIEMKKRVELAKLEQ